MTKSLVSKKNFLAVATAPKSAQAQTVEYLTPEEVYAIADAIRNESPQRPGRNGESPKATRRDLTPCAFL